MARKGENIRKRKDGRWEGRITVTCDNGEKKVYSLYDNSYQKVKEKIYDTRKKLSVSTAIFNSKKNGLLKSAGSQDMNWDLLAREWLENIKRTKKYSTFIKYQNIYQNYIKEFFVTCSLDKTIEPPIIEEIFEKTTNRSDSTAKSIRSVLKSVFTYAKEQYKLTAPDLKKRDYRNNNNNSIQVLTRAEQTSLCRYLMENMDCKMLGILICITTGIRLGEICSLKWSDIDFRNGILRINTTVQRISVEGADRRTSLVETMPKTSCSQREIPLPEIVLDLLTKYNCTGTYIINKDMPMEPRTYQNIWKKCQKEAGISYKNFHCLRHTFATNCIEQGIDVKSLSEILGHSDVKTTLNRYVHPSIATKRSHINSVCVCFINTQFSSAVSMSGHN